jgi:hypothetical protein
MDVNSNLKRFNAWWDIFILEAIKPVAILSMGMGTVAVFNLQGLAIQPWFVVSWATVQALSIDGLFFATWDRLFSLKLQKAHAWAIVGLLFIGIIMAIIAIAINAVLAFQVLWDIANSENAMARLGISPELFTAIRAVLAVVVFIFISYVRARARANEQPSMQEVMAKRTAAKKATISHTVTIEEAKPIAIPEVAVSHSSNKYELFKEAIARASERGEKINLTVIAQEIDAGYSTVKLYKKRMKAEQ